MAPTYKMPDYLKDDRRVEDWSSNRGLRRAILAGTVYAVLLGTLLSLLGVREPLLVMHVAVRVVVTYLIAWVLFGVVHRAAGMVGTPCTVLVIVLTVLVLLSNHVVFAVVGVRLDGKTTPPAWDWLQPGALAMANVVPILLGLGGCVLLHHNDAVGAASDDTVTTWIWTRWIR